MYLFFALIFGLLINYFTGGLEFYSTICVFAGIFLIMPFLLKTNIKEIFKIKENKFYIYNSLFRNYIINIFLFGIFPIFIFGFNSIILGFLLLGILSGGGLLLSWINKTKGDTKLGFKLFFINFLIFNIIFLIGSLYFPQFYDGLEINNNKNQIENNIKNNKNNVYNVYNYNLNDNIENIKNNKDNNKKEQNTCIVSEITNDKLDCFGSDGKVSPLSSFLILIIFPFILSRFIILIKPLKNIINKNINKISSFFTFILIAYIFSLKDLHGLFNTEISILLKIGITTLIIYIAVYFYNYYLFFLSKKTEKDITLFWIGSTRFITLGFIFSFIYSLYLGTEIILIFIFAYIYQIILSIYFSKKIKKIGFK